MKITFLSHNAFYISISGLNIMIDPFITGNTNCKQQVEDFNNVDYILISHGHGDHFGDAIEIAKNSGATIITNFEIANYIEMTTNLKTHSMHIGGKFAFDKFSLKLTNAVHGCSIIKEKEIIYGGNPCGFLITSNEKSVYFACDTGLTYDMKLLAYDNVDVAFLPIGDNYTMGIEDAVRAVEMINPKLAVPVHYNTFDIIKADPYEFEKKNIFSRTRIMDSGDTIEI